MYIVFIDVSISIKFRNKIIELNVWVLIIINRSNIKEKKIKVFGDRV